MPHALRYLQIYFGGVSTVILYNICMSIMRALGDSIHPLYYLLFSSIVNIGLDLLFVAHPAFHWGVTGAAAATVISQGLSVILCLFRMCRIKDYTRLDFKKLHYHSHMMKKVLYQGLPRRHSECRDHRRQPGDSEEYQFLRPLTLCPEWGPTPRLRDSFSFRL